MKHTVERVFSNLKYERLGWSYQNFDDMLKELLYWMRDKIGHPFIGKDYYNLRFFMNLPIYHEFSIVCQTSGHDSDMYRGIKITADPTLYVNDGQYGIVRLIYEEKPEVRDSYLSSVRKVTHEFFLPSAKPHIDHVIFNGPATIVFWKDGTKTVVKLNEEYVDDRRKAILYAFMRKIYGEGKPYHNILNEIEEAIK